MANCIKHQMLDGTIMEGPVHGPGQVCIEYESNNRRNNMPAHTNRQSRRRVTPRRGNVNRQAQNRVRPARAKRQRITNTRGTAARAAAPRVRSGRPIRRNATPRTRTRRPINSRTQPTLGRSSANCNGGYGRVNALGQNIC